MIYSFEKSLWLFVKSFMLDVQFYWFMLSSSIMLNLVSISQLELQLLLLGWLLTVFMLQEGILLVRREGNGWPFFHLFLFGVIIFFSFLFGGWGWWFWLLMMRLAFKWWNSVTLQYMHFNLSCFLAHAFFFSMISMSGSCTILLEDIFYLDFVKQVLLFRVLRSWINLGYDREYIGTTF